MVFTGVPEVRRESRRYSGVMQTVTHICSRKPVHNFFCIFDELLT